LGSGGESIVLKKSVEIENQDKFCGLKLVPILKNPELIVNFFGITNVDSELAYEKNKPRELTANSVKHENIIKTFGHTFEVIDGNLFHITGKLIYFF